MWVLRVWGSGQSVREGGDSAELGARQATREQQCSDREERDGALAIRRGMSLDLVENGMPVYYFAARAQPPAVAPANDILWDAGVHARPLERLHPSPSPARSPSPSHLLPGCSYNSTLSGDYARAAAAAGAGVDINFPVYGGVLHASQASNVFQGVFLTDTTPMRTHDIPRSPLVGHKKNAAPDGIGASRACCPARENEPFKKGSTNSRGGGRME